MTQQIKPKAICCFRNGEYILVAEYYNEKTDQFYYRPLGGKIEFGENSSTALKREIKEELNAEIHSLRLLDTVENIYFNKGKTSHELLFIYDGEFEDESFYSLDEFKAFEHTDERTFTAKWISIFEFLNGMKTLYPPELIDILLKEIEVAETNYIKDKPLLVN